MHWAVPTVLASLRGLNFCAILKGCYGTFFALIFGSKQTSLRVIFGKIQLSQLSKKIGENWRDWRDWRIHNAHTAVGTTIRLVALGGWPQR